MLNISSIHRKISFFLILIIGIGCSHSEEPVSLKSKEFLRLKNILEDGTWGWDSDYCTKSPQTIVIDVDKKIMTLTIDNLVESSEKTKDTFIYNIKQAWKTGFRGKIRNEKRVDKDGQIVEWDLFVVDNHRFYWRRSDWRKNAASKPILKCLPPSHETSRN